MGAGTFVTSLYVSLNDRTDLCDLVETGSVKWRHRNSNSPLHPRVNEGYKSTSLQKELPAPSSPVVSPEQHRQAVGVQLQLSSLPTDNKHLHLQTIQTNPEKQSNSEDTSIYLYKYFGVLIILFQPEHGSFPHTSLKPSIQIGSWNVNTPRFIWQGNSSGPFWNLNHLSAVGVLWLKNIQNL